MAMGPGKYDDVATMARIASQARGGVIVIVLGGVRGSGFSVQSEDPETMNKLPELLRTMADQIEQDLKNVHIPTK
jgi:hypothetical protein